MPRPPKKHKNREDWSVEDILEHQRTGAEPIADDFNDYLRDTAQAAGLEPADLGLDGPTTKPLEDLTVDEHLDRLNRSNR